MTDLVKGLPSALLEAVDRFVLAPEVWAVPQTLATWVRSDTSDLDSWLRQTTFDHSAPFAEGTLSDKAIQRLMAKASPLSSVDLGLLTCDWRHRLALLSKDEWSQLGLCLSALPFCGHLQRTMDGHLRRALRHGLELRVVDALDKQTAAAEMIDFTAGPGAWKYPQQLAWGGVRAAIEQVCCWPDSVQRRTLMRFDLEQLRAPVCVVGLDAHWLEMSCRLMWPEHPWLWS
jgi:hypothetical protein